MMTMNKNSNTYTFIYASVMVILVAAALALVSDSLKAKQQRNVDIDKMMQILTSVKVDADMSNAEAKYAEVITAAYAVNAKGEKTITDAKQSFIIDVAKEMAKPVEERNLPVYEATVEGNKKYIIPLYGAGLWGPIWGYVSLEGDANTIFAASFSHKGETPGLGAEITTSNFQTPFTGKQIFRDGQFRSIAVMKAGVKSETQDQVDAISGGTITSKGVEAMLYDCLSVYEAFLKTIKED